MKRLLRYTPKAKKEEMKIENAIISIPPTIENMRRPSHVSCLDKEDNDATLIRLYDKDEDNVSVMTDTDTVESSVFSKKQTSFIINAKDLIPVLQEEPTPKVRKVYKTKTKST